MEIGVKRERDGSVVGGSSGAVGACAYLDTVERRVLDFDRPRECSVTLSSSRVHMCLSCGVMLQGRGPRSPAHAHSLERGHHLFLDLEHASIWSLPGEEEVLDGSLEDIRAAVRPRLRREEVEALDSWSSLCVDSLGQRYLPGCMGLNNVGATDSLGCVVQVLSRVGPLRDFFLSPPDAMVSENRSELVAAFGSLLRRLWSPHALRSSASPHALAAAVARASRGRFVVGQRWEMAALLGWLLHQLHQDLLHAFPGDASAQAAAAKADLDRVKRTAGRVGQSRLRQAQKRAQEAAQRAKAGRWRDAGGTAPGHSIVTECFRGIVEVSTQRAGAEEEGGGGEGGFQRVPCMFLTLDLPPTPVFREDVDEGTTIPAVPLWQLLRKFDGVTVSESLGRKGREKRTYRIARLPPFLLLHFRRFARNAYFTEKNPTIVTMPLRGLDLAPLLPPTTPVSLRERAKYDLVASVVHDPPQAGGEAATEKGRKSGGGGGGGGEGGVMVGKGGSGAAVAAVAAATGLADPVKQGHYRTLAFHDGAQEWFQLSDLQVKKTVATTVAATEESSLALFRAQALAPKRKPEHAEASDEE